MTTTETSGSETCDSCGARFPPDARACEYCGVARPMLARAAAPELRIDADDLRRQMAAARDALDVVQPSSFWWLHGGIFILVGVIFTSTVIGAIVGIPAILVGINSWKKGAAAARR